MKCVIMSKRIQDISSHRVMTRLLGLRLVNSCVCKLCKLCTLWGVQSVVKLCFVSDGEFGLPSGMHSGTCQKLVTKYPTEWTPDSVQPPKPGKIGAIHTQIITKPGHGFSMLSHDS